MSVERLEELRHLIVGEPGKREVDVRYRVQIGHEPRGDGENDRAVGEGEVAELRCERGIRAGQAREGTGHGTGGIGDND